MDDYPENMLRKLCCTCLSVDHHWRAHMRSLMNVDNMKDIEKECEELGMIRYVNTSRPHFAVAEEGFYKDTASLHICWECRAVMNRISRFRWQACKAQKLLSSIVDGRQDYLVERECLSNLTEHHTTECERLTSVTCSQDNFIDCGLAVKSESDLEDIPLSELNSCLQPDPETKSSFMSEIKDETYMNPFKKKSKKNGLKINRHKKYFTVTHMSEAEMYASREGRRLAASFADATYKCELCIIGFKSQIDLDGHNEVHIEKSNCSQCHVCKCYIENGHLNGHVTTHSDRYACVLCEYVCYTSEGMVRHVETDHTGVGRGVKRMGPKTRVSEPGSKHRKNQTTIDKRTPYGYLCKECNKYFDNKNQRWKHVQRCHREGYKCAECDKRFAFKNNLTRHEQLHQAPLPREECPECHKMIRVDLVKVHARIHSNRERMTCGECGKWFASRASYEHHLKYTRPHAPFDVLKHKCSICDKGYRSRGELRDHVNYQHLATTRHKCPVCDKPLATRRCITRHVRRAHDGVKESARDKICQQCGKAFRVWQHFISDKKGLREHELIHSGERPLACEICGGTFRQSASLYTHKKRVHHIYPAKKNVKLVDS